MMRGPCLGATTHCKVWGGIHMGNTFLESEFLPQSGARRALGGSWL